MNATRATLCAWRSLYGPDLSNEAFEQLELSVNELLRQNARSAFPFTAATQSAIETLIRAQLVTWLATSDPDHSWHWHDGVWHATLIREHFIQIGPVDPPGQAPADSG